MLKTGITIIDRELGGGLKKGSSVLIMGAPGVDDLQFAHQCFFSHLEEDGPGVYLVNNKKPSLARAFLAEYDWDVSSFEKQGRCSFIDAYSGLLSVGSDEKAAVDDPTDLDSVLDVAKEAVEGIESGGIFVVDSVSSFIDITDDDKRVVRFVKELAGILKKKGVTLVALFTRWPYDDKTLHDIESLFDCIIRLKAMEQKVILRSFFSIEKVGWVKDLEKKDIPYRVVSPGGVKVFIPKILITGPFNAGKTSFIHSASTRAVSVDRLGTTVALDHGHVDFKGFSVDLFGTPGQERFDPILKMLGGESLGVIVVVDSTDPDGFARAKEMLKLTRTEGLPSVIVANKADLEGALKPDEIRDRMSLDEDVHIVPVVAADIGKVKEGKPCELKEEDVQVVLDELFRSVI